MYLGYASGAFDMFHIGHLNLLRRASFLCDYLLVGVATDDLYEQLRRRRPIIPFEERLAIVRRVRFVDAAVGDSYADKRDAWEMYRFDAIIKGDDWRRNPNAPAMIGRLAEVGVDVHFVPYTAHTSSSRIRSMLARMETQLSGSESERGPLTSGTLSPGVGENGR